MNHANGDSIIVMEDDLQHDPGDIPELLAGLEKGPDVCYAKFKTKKQNRLKNFGSWFNDKAANIILKKPREVYLSPYKAIKRNIVNEIIKYDGPYPYIDGLIYRITGAITQIHVDHHPRYSGKGNYNLRKSIRVWMKLATNFSIFPLRIATFMGFAASIAGFVLMIVFVIQYFVYRAAPTGWPSLIVTILFLGGIQLIAVGIIGEYVGRLFLHQSSHPQFVIREKTESK